MLYLLDANVLIDASNGFFQLDRVPQFWDWLIAQGEGNSIAIPREIWEEFKDGEDLLAEWARTDEVKKQLLLDEEADPVVVDQVVSQGYAPDLTDAEVIELGRDPFLIGYAYTSVAARGVVTTEVSKPGKKRGRRHIPNVCGDLGVTCLNTVGLINRLDFRIR
jgi:hypothetical protein